MALLELLECGNPPNPADILIDNEVEWGFAYLAEIRSWHACVMQRVTDEGLIAAGPFPFHFDWSAITYFYRRVEYHQDMLKWKDDISSHEFNALSIDIDSIGDKIDVAETAITDAIDSSQTDITTAITASTDTISLDVTDAVFNLETAIVSSADDVSQSVNESISAQVAFLEDLLDYLRNESKDVGDLVELIREQQLGRVIGFIGTQTELIAKSTGRIASNIFSTITSLDTTLQAKLGRIESVIRESVGGTLTGLSAGIANIAKEIGELPEDFESVARRLGEDLAGFIGQVLLEVSPGIGTVVLDKVEEFSNTIDPEMDTVLDLMLNTIATSEGVSPIVTELLTRNIEGANPIWAFLKSAVAPFILGNMSSALLQPEIQRLLQEHSKLVNWQLLPLPDIITGLRRGIIPEELGKEEAEKHGFWDWQYDAAKKLIETVPDQTQALAWFYRGLISEETLKTVLNNLGYDKDNVDNILDASQLIPPVGDLITMAVREVFSPAVAEKFGQFDDFPDQFRKEAAKHGLTEEWAKRYWAAHWGLPSLSMGYEMLHRGVITESELDLLLRSQDVMPFWRERLKKISYRNLTRVDVRRMYSLGVLTEEEVLKSFTDYGYSQENARRMTQFVVEVTASTSGMGDSEPKDLTRALVIKLYIKGIINRESALARLLSLGFSANDAELLLSLTDIETVLEGREDAINELSVRLDSGDFSEVQAKEHLLSIGFNSTETAKGYKEAIRRVKRRTAIPSKDDLKAMLKKKLITRNEAQQGLLDLGYSLAWSRKLIILIGGYPSATR